MSVRVLISLSQQHVYCCTFQFYKFVFGERRNNAAFISQEQDFVTETVHQLKDEVKATRQQCVSPPLSLSLSLSPHMWTTSRYLELTCFAKVARIFAICSKWNVKMCLSTCLTALCLFCRMAQTAALQKQSLELIKQLCDQLQVNYTLDNISLPESNRPATRGRPR